MNWKSVAKALMPPPVLRARQSYQRWHRHRRRTRQRGNAVTLSDADLRGLLAQLNIGLGDLLLVHSSLGNFNNVVGGPAGVLRCLEATLGPTGTLVMPAFPNWTQTVSQIIDFDVMRTPSTVGVLTELLRMQPDAKRSLHPTHSVVARGPRADWLVTDHHRSPYAFGSSSPYFRHAMEKGKILLIGINMNCMTSFHVYEDLIAPTLWLPVYNSETLVFRLSDADGVRHAYDGYFHSLEYADKRNVEALRERLVSCGALKIINTDFSYLMAIDALAMVITCLEELLLGRSAYGEVSVSSAERRRIERVLSTLKQHASELMRSTA